MRGRENLSIWDLADRKRAQGSLYRNMEACLMMKAGLFAFHPTTDCIAMMEKDAIKIYGLRDDGDHALLVSIPIYQLDAAVSMTFNAKALAVIDEKGQLWLYRLSTGEDEDGRATVEAKRVLTSFSIAGSVEVANPRVKMDERRLYVYGDFKQPTDDCLLLFDVDLLLSAAGSGMSEVAERALIARIALWPHNEQQPEEEELAKTGPSHEWIQERRQQRSVYMWLGHSSITVEGLNRYHRTIVTFDPTPSRSSTSGCVLS